MEICISKNELKAIKLIARMKVDKNNKVVRTCLFNELIYRYCKYVLKINVQELMDKMVLWRNNVGVTIVYN